MACERSSRIRRRVKQRVDRSLSHPRLALEFGNVHFISSALAHRFYNHFSSQQVKTSYYIDLDAFEDLVISGRSVKSILEAIG